jgi:hypothetical protein
MQVNVNVRIETEEDFFADLLVEADKLDHGIVPSTTVEHISFPDFITFNRYSSELFHYRRLST